MHDQPDAEQLCTIPTSQLSTLAGGSYFSGVRPLQPGDSHGTSPPPSPFTMLPGASPRPPLDPGLTPGYGLRIGHKVTILKGDYGV